jgi:hypothetical protein
MLAEGAVLTVKVFLPQRRRFDDVAVGIEYRKVFLRHLLLHTMFCIIDPQRNLALCRTIACRHRATPPPGHPLPIGQPRRVEQLKKAGARLAALNNDLIR